MPDPGYGSLLLALLAVALSAWVRWKLAASALLFGIFFISSALGAMVNEVLATRAGNVLSLGYVIGIIWANMLRLSTHNTLFGEMFNIRRGDEIPQYMAWLMLGVVCAACIWTAEPSAAGERGGIVTVAAETQQPVVQPPAELIQQTVEFSNVSKFYGEVLGVNRVNLVIPPGVTSLVGPNGSGKTTLMNLMTGLIRPTCGEMRVLGLTPDDPERFFRSVGYCTQFDSFPKGVYRT